MMLYVIGSLKRLPPTVRQAVTTRRTRDPTKASAAVAVCPADGIWTDRQWSQIRAAWQDHGLPVHATWIDADGCSRRPPKVWPGSRWDEPRTSRCVVWYALRKDPKFDPAQTRVLFENSKHFGKTLEEAGVSYCDWLVGQDWLDPHSFLGRMLRLYLGRLAEQHLSPLGEDRYDTRGFSPLDAAPGLTILSVMEYEQQPGDIRWRSPQESDKRVVKRVRKPGLWQQTRPWTQAWAEDEALNQAWHHSGQQRLLWREGLNLPPMHVLRERRRRNGVYWAFTGGKVQVKGGKDDGQRVAAWDRALEAIDQVSAATDFEELEERRRRASTLVELLAQSEGWPEDNALKDEVEEAFARRKDQLERREEQLGDYQLANATNSKKHKASKLAADPQEARVTEAVRRMRGCRTLDELEEAGAWVRRHKDLFEEDSLARLRTWYGYFLSQLSKRDKDCNQTEKYTHFLNRLGTASCYVLRAEQ